ncbi:glycosyltransferase [Ascidiimonas aurantiaca]|uniref:glycosyltransferase n=1 Tax=Ascidiimonas aurantiaca TaxID=1685432 RepID=UPI0030EF822A
MNITFSLIIPVYNRPDEIQELLESLLKQDFDKPYEIVIVEDGSTHTSKEIVNAYRSQLGISYFFKSNSGPGDSRNFGMKKAKGNYFIILDSDCILPPHYLTAVWESLTGEYIDCFGGPDTAHKDFTVIQKAINYAMTSFITTGGIRGKKKAVNRFQPRSFNMGISKKAFEATGGFGKIHPGEDPDLTIRIWNAGFNTRLIPEAYVYHKRRISWKKFYQQVHKFGLTRPILNHWHPQTKKITYWFPAVFLAGILAAILFAIAGMYYPLYAVGLYFIIIFADSLLKNKNLLVALFSVFAVLVQFTGYGYGFVKSTFQISLLGKKPETAFPKLFFK